jgi:hypothetical protein
MNRSAPLYRWATLTIVACILAGCPVPGPEAPYQYHVYGCDRNGDEAQRRAC